MYINFTFSAPVVWNSLPQHPPICTEDPPVEAGLRSI